MKRIVKAEEAKEKRKAFKQSGGKSRSLGNAETLSINSMASSPSRPALMGRSESVSRHSINLNNDKKGYLTPKSSGTPPPSHLAVPKTSGTGLHNFVKRKLSDSASEVILSCIEKSRVDPSSRVLNRMVHNRADFATFCVNLGEENWTRLADQFRNYLTDVLSNLANTEKVNYKNS
uniref:IMD domain-containing protein n=1 Tax=Meloidogyne hapla TaxID=6305 RepID=A0A1I8AYZ1_MELHA